uniref:NADH-ubiquinone oxidoreductase chain 6 n=1 Tax=Birmella discoidalisa TaxID=2060665 RepID=A0A2H4ZQT3_9HYME|nr:NADH dehydrogenase subunit 6 [Birmella discoidalisa]
MNMMLMVMMIMNSLIFFSMKTPLSMGLMLMIQTLLISLYSGLMSSNFWYSYILFLIMIGGMLILFLYTSSISSNKKFNYNKKKMLMCLMITIILIFILMYSKFKFHTNFNYDMMSMKNIEIEENFLLKMSMNKLYNKPTNLIMILMINYLMLTMFIIVKITNIKMGPLRKYQ